MQTKLESLTEKVIEKATGGIIAFLITLYALPLFNPTVMTLAKGIAITSMYFTVSLIFGYGIRRFFNGRNKC